MNRLLFFVLLVSGIGTASYLVLFSKFGIGGTLSGGATLFEYLKEVFTSVKSGSWAWSEFSSAAVFTYGLVALLFINAVLLVSLLVMMLTTLFKLSKVYRFYATVWWYLFAAVLFTGAVAFVLIDAGGDIIGSLKTLPWQFYVPLGSALVLSIVGAVFKRTENI